jgi:hypothetical protein
MKTRGIVLQGLDFGKGRDAEHGTPQRLSMFDPMVDSGSITEGKDVAEWRNICGSDRCRGKGPELMSPPLLKHAPESAHYLKKLRKS